MVDHSDNNNRPRPNDDGLDEYEALWNKYLVPVQIVLSFADYGVLEDLARFSVVAADEEKSIRDIMSACIEPSAERIGPILVRLKPRLIEQGMVADDEEGIRDLESVAVTIYTCRLLKVLGVLPATEDLPQALAIRTWPGEG